jgi:hypothetical protein
MTGESKNKTMPKGGRKGGTQFPRLDLKQATDFAKKLVSKTHTGPQSEKIILPGVFNNAGPAGKVRAAAMKQYDLLKGSPQGYEASDLAKQIVAAPPNEVFHLFQNACLKPKLFKNLHDTFHSDTVTTGKIRQQAAHLNVHPDSLDECVSIFVKSVVFAGLATEKDENIDFVHVEGLPKPSETTDASTSAKDLKAPEQNGNEEKLSRDIELDAGADSLRKAAKTQVEIKIDPSMDPEKLDKLLGVLKKYGQI